MFSWWLRIHCGVLWWFHQLFRYTVNPRRLRNTDLHNMRLGGVTCNNIWYCLQHCNVLKIAKQTVIMREVYNTTDWLSFVVFSKTGDHRNVETTFAYVQIIHSIKLFFLKDKQIERMSSRHTSLIYFWWNCTF